MMIVPYANPLLGIVKEALLNRIKTSPPSGLTENLFIKVQSLKVFQNIS